jgi:phosphomannomutase
VLPILSVLHLAAERGLSLPELFAELPPRFGKAGLLDGIPPKTSRAILKRLSSEGGALEIASLFSRDLGFGSVQRSDTTDGLRLYFDNGDIAHIRPSGNAPQLRIYAVASTDARANEIVRHAVAEPDGILRKLARGSRIS